MGSSSVAGESKDKGTSPTLQTVERALSFLECVSASKSPQTIREIAQELGVNLTTGYHLFNTLYARNYIERNPDGTLRIGVQTAALFEGYKRGFSRQQQMNDLVDRLAGETSESAYLSMHVNNSIVLTAFTEGSQAIRAAGLYVGLSGFEYIRSAGRAVLAFLEPESREAVLEHSLSSLAPSQRPQVREELASELDVIRERGWAIDDQEYETGIVGISAPFFSAGRNVLGAIGVWAPATRAYESKADLIRRVLAASRDATSTVGAVH